MSDPRIDPGVAEAQRARDELYDTLGQLRDRLDYAQRIDDRVAQMKHCLGYARRENPVAFTVGAVAVAAAVGAAAWGAVKLIQRTFR
ncbi:MAG: DUF3618 domain-containing protein [Actinobacteria bacterium]|nr:DUF3618 domain-containing protein [Actinomycetota bacterium]